jgi:hypothetical protein
MYRIFNSTPERFNKLPPCDIDYKRNTSIALAKVVTLTKGRVLQVMYSDFNNELILDVNIVYNDATGDANFPLSRTTTRSWFDVSGVNHNILDFDKTVKIKKYNPRQTIEEGIIRRTNIIASIFTNATSMGYGEQAKARIRNNASEIQSYKLVGDTSIRDVVQNDSSVWLDNYVPNTGDTVTMRQLIIGALTI